MAMGPDRREPSPAERLRPVHPAPLAPCRPPDAPAGAHRARSARRCRLLPLDLIGADRDQAGAPSGRQYDMAVGLFRAARRRRGTITDAARPVVPALPEDAFRRPPTTA